MSDVVTPKNISDTARDLLLHHRGLFIGQTHGDRLSVGFMTSNMRMLKEAGVTTLYVEYNIYKARAAQGGQECRQEFVGPSVQGPDAISNTQLVIDRATAAGLRVIGYDSLTGNSWQFDRLDGNAEIDRRVASGGPAVDQRDDFAATVINRTYDGKKFVVYGGFAHSGNEAGDRPSHRGLDQRLGIPSIDFLIPGDFTARENLATRTGEGWTDFWSDSAPIHMRPGVNGESTYKVTSLNSFALSPRGDTLTGDEHQRLQALAEAIQQSGGCRFPPFLEGKEFLSMSDVDNLARYLKKPGPPPRQP